jgi:thiol:disulfide interchange protein
VNDTSTNTLVLFTAPAWCVPCRRFEPHWEKAQQAEVLDEFDFIKVDMGATPEDTSLHWATARYHILGVPTVLLFNHGQYRPVVARAIVPFIKELVG